MTRQEVKNARETIAMVIIIIVMVIGFVKLGDSNNKQMRDRNRVHKEMITRGING